MTGNVDPKKVLEFAPGELQNLPGWTPLGDGANKSTLSGFDAVQLGGNYTKEGKKRIIAQKTVVIPGQDGLYGVHGPAHGRLDESARRLVDGRRTAGGDQAVCPVLSDPRVSRLDCRDALCGGLLLRGLRGAVGFVCANSIVDEEESARRVCGESAEIIGAITSSAFIPRSG
ncbi:MAG: LpqN/LpqT family lipoprotein [Mycolicibacterium aromaticivorans]|nr:LpqN/LpqT family lipoprotein [Mycolicibacterium aromaticivorans]